MPIETSESATSAPTDTSAPPETPATSTPATVAPFAYGTGPCPPAEVTEPVRTFDAAPQLCIDPAATYAARFVTDRGDIVVELDAAESPGTVNNFVTLARYGYYDDTLLFRTNTTIDIIQGGGTVEHRVPRVRDPRRGQRVTRTRGRRAGDGPHRRTELGRRPVVLHRHRQGLGDTSTPGTYVVVRAR